MSAPYRRLRSISTRVMPAAFQRKRYCTLSSAAPGFVTVQSMDVVRCRLPDTAAMTVNRSTESAKTLWLPPSCITTPRISMNTEARARISCRNSPHARIQRPVQRNSDSLFVQASRAASRTRSCQTRRWGGKPVSTELFRDALILLHGIFHFDHPSLLAAISQFHTGNNWRPCSRKCPAASLFPEGFCPDRT